MVRRYSNSETRIHSMFACVGGFARIKRPVASSYRAWTHYPETEIIRARIRMISAAQGGVQVLV
ncbi:hypothetical protein, partial [Bradyrhizobium sp. Leo121]|uniref:hypothetical protein n=1 Tax=Bradyrhizobium sp. Leo121 TaxID=1571195 RepID=UPI001A92380D